MAEKHGKWYQKCSNIEPTSMQKTIKNQCQNKYRTISSKSLNFVFFWMVKSIKFIIQTSVFEGLAGCVCERKRYIKHINQFEVLNQWKSMRKRCAKNWRIDAVKTTAETWVGGWVGGTNNTKPTVNILTVNIPTVNIPTVNIPTVKTQKTTCGKHKKQTKKTPLARHSRKRVDR